MDVTEAYRASRDQLLGLRGRHEQAVAEFRWPELGDRFNWAVDWFDAVARDSDRPALVLVEEDGTTTRRSYAEMSRASDRLAAWLAGRGVGKSDPVLLMLGNQVELWESMLAVAKLGAVIMPTTTAVGPAEEPKRVLAALGPKMLELSATRADGAHPYLTTPEHTRFAREVVGLNSRRAEVGRV